MSSAYAGPANSWAAAFNAAATALQPLATMNTSSTSSLARSLHVTGALLDKSCAGSSLAAHVASKLFSAVAWPAHDPIGSDSAANPVVISAGSHLTRPLNSVAVGVVTGVVVTVVVVEILVVVDCDVVLVAVMVVVDCDVVLVAVAVAVDCDVVPVADG